MTSSTSLPSERDFDPFNVLDAKWAWKNFGGLDLEQAKAKFRENPLNYQEDFAFMGGRAFAYYFPVIEDHLHSVPDQINDHDHEAWILAHCIKAQFHDKNVADVRHLTPRIICLANFVRGNIHRFGDYEFDYQRVADAWTELVHHIGIATTT